MCPVCTKSLIDIKNSKMQTTDFYRGKTRYLYLVKIA